MITGMDPSITCKSIFLSVDTFETGVRDDRVVDMVYEDTYFNFERIPYHISDRVVAKPCV